MSNNFGYELPKAMHPEFGKAVKAACDAAGTEITPQQVFALFKKEYRTHRNFRRGQRPD